MSKSNSRCSWKAKIVSTTCTKFLSQFKISKACLWPNVLNNHLSTRTLHHNTGILLNPVPSLRHVPHADLLSDLGSATFQQPPNPPHFLFFPAILFQVEARSHCLPHRMCAAHPRPRSHHVPTCPSTTYHLQIQWPQSMLMLRPTYCWHALTYAWLWCPCTSLPPSHVLRNMHEGKK